MIWNELSSGNLSVEYNFGDGIWTQQKNVLRVSVAGASASVRVSVEINDADYVEYVTDNSGHVLVDLSDVIRSKQQGETMSILVEYLSDSVGISASVFGLIDPREMIIPQSTSNTELAEVAIIAPPHKWLQPLFGLSDSVEFFIAPQAQFAEFLYSIRALQNITVSLSGLQAVQIPAAANSMSLRGSVVVGDTVGVQCYKRSELLCGRTYAAVEWLSRAGMRKRHTLEVVRVTYSTDGATEFQSALGFDVTKGQAVGFTLRLQGLTRYDYWYYSDIITSNDVRVAVAEIDADFGDETRVQIVTSKAVIPDSAGAYNLEIEVKYKRYDEF